jgi:DNA-binding MarR family transcriptional regulator
VLTHTYLCVIFVSTNNVITHKMGEVLRKRLKSTKEISVREEVDLNLRIAAVIIDSRFNSMMEPFGISGVQYNVLRILKGVFPEGHARCEIASRMIERASDVTRIIDRLERQGLVERDRDNEDRRMSITRITRSGIEIVEKIKPLIEKEHKVNTKNLTDEECKLLSELIEKLYEDM